MAARMSDQWPPRPPDDTEQPRRGRIPPVPAPSARAQSPTDDVAGYAATSGPADVPEPTSRNRRALVVTVAVVIALLAIAALASGRVTAPGAPTFPPAGATTGPAGAAAAATKAVLADALAGQGLQLEDIPSPYRPAEAPRLATAPRLVVRVVIPTDPDHGRLVIYEFRDTGSATVAAQEQASYVSSGVGRVQFPPQTQFTLRVVGSTVVFFPYSTVDVPDPERATAIAAALANLGFEVPVPN